MQVYVGLSGTEVIGHYLLIGNEGEKGFFAMVKGRDVVFYLDRETVQLFSADLLTEAGSSERSPE